MIVYFSATGNCKSAAERIAEATNDTVASMTDVKNITLKDGEQLGIVTPTYFWGLPTYVDDFLSRIEINNAKKSYIYCVVTYGTTPGQVEYFVDEHLKDKGLCLSAGYAIKTVDNWTVWFDVKDKNKIKSQLNNAAKQTECIIEMVKQQKSLFIQSKLPLFLCKKAKYFYNRARKTSHLHVNANCISCGLCEKNCPIKAIEVVDGKPRWTLERCVMCLKCLHICPGFAIRYDNKTERNGQYVHPDLKK